MVIDKRNFAVAGDVLRSADSQLSIVRRLLAGKADELADARLSCRDHD
jgi:hypothetical protein